MNDEITKKDEDEIDLIDLFVVLLRFRKLIIVSILTTFLLILIGYFFYPSYKFKNLEKQDYTNASLSISINTVLSDYYSSENVTSEIAELFKQPKLILESILLENNMNMLTIENDSSVEDYTIIKERLIPEKVTSFSLATYECDYSLLNNWLYDIKVKSNTINLVFLLQEIDTKVAVAILNNLYNSANNTILEMLRPNLEKEIETIEAALGSTDSPNLDTNKLLNELAHTQGLIDGEILPLVKISEPIAFVEGPNKSLKKIKNNYIKKGLILLMAVLFLSIFFSFILEFVRNIKKDDERMAKIREALGRKV